MVKICYLTKADKLKSLKSNCFKRFLNVLLMAYLDFTVTTSLMSVLRALWGDLFGFECLFWRWCRFGIQEFYDFIWAESVSGMYTKSRWPSPFSNWCGWNLCPPQLATACNSLIASGSSGSRGCFARVYPIAFAKAVEVSFLNVLLRRLI